MPSQVKVAGGGGSGVEDAEPESVSRGEHVWLRDCGSRRYRLLDILWDAN